MKFMLMMHAPRGTGDWAVADWKPEDLKAHIGFMAKFAKDLKEAGEWVAGEGWPHPGRRGSCAPAPPARPKSPTAHLPRPRSSWPATGSWTSRAPQRAYSLAAAASAAPGPGGAPIRIPIEVREVMSAPPVEP